jgi:2-polyprenyl-3-methyl-5-hydroxy-6-metoxy-1,4-benzoquinol methylase
MSIYSTTEGVESYIEMAEGFNGAEFIPILKNYLLANSTILELGIGAGKDQQLLKDAGFISTASDSSEQFIERYNRKNSDKKAIFVDAIKMDIDEKFDAVYSNKVLQHLNDEELRESFINQAKHLKSGGILFLSLWYGTDSGNMGGVFYQSHTEKSLSKLIPDSLEVVEFTRFTEMDKDDSFWAVLKMINE